MTLKRTAARLLALLRKRRLDQDLDEEILAHLELAEQDGIAAGLSPREARRRARVQFGGIVNVQQEHRDRRSPRWVETFLRDLRHGVQGLARDPGFSAVVVSVLALGIGANVAMFSLVDAVLFKPLPFEEPQRIVRVLEEPRPGGSNSTSTLDYLDWKRLATEFEVLSAERSVAAALTGAGEPRRLSGKVVTANYFQVFTANVALGRTFLEGEDQAGAEPVIVLSHAAWLSHFGGDPDILRQRPILNGEPHQVVGVLQPGAFDRDRAEYWKPLIFTAEQQTRGMHWLQVYGRLRKGLTVAQARERMELIDAALADVTPEFKLDWRIVVKPFESLLVGDSLRQSMFVAFGAVALVLLIACANVANLLLAKGAARRKELAVRAALGAGRGRLVAQLLTESLALCAAGCVAGLAVAVALIRVSTPAFSQMIPFTADVGLDYRALAFAAAVALGVALLVGALPALQTDSAKLSRTLNRTSRGASGGHAGLRRALVIGEVAVSLVLVCGAALLLRSLFNLQRLDTGVRIENVITLAVDLPMQDYPTAERAAQFYETVTERLEAAPGVEQAAAASHLPLRWIGNGEGVKVPGVEELINTRFKRVDPGYFEALGIPMLSGRGIEASDRLGAPTAVVINEAMAARLADVAGVTDPVGQTVEISTPGYSDAGEGLKPYEIVGVIRSERVSSPGDADPPVSYVAMAQLPATGARFLARTQSSPASVIPAIRAAIREIDPNLPIGDIATMEQVRDSTLVGATRPAWVIGSFAAVAALLAAVGLYGVLAQSVTLERRDIGIRMALGAGAGDVVAKVLKHALAMIAVGLALGLAGALAATRVIQSMLFDTSALDPLALAAACVTMALLGLLAAMIPARRAAGVEPMRVLREDG